MILIDAVFSYGVTLGVGIALGWALRSRRAWQRCRILAGLPRR